MAQVRQRVAQRTAVYMFRSDKEGTPRRYDPPFPSLPLDASPPKVSPAQCAARHFPHRSLNTVVVAITLTLIVISVSESRKRLS